MFQGSIRGGKVASSCFPSRPKNFQETVERKRRWILPFLALVVLPELLKISLKPQSIFTREMEGCSVCFLTDYSMLYNHSSSVASGSEHVLAWKQGTCICVGMRSSLSLKLAIAGLMKAFQGIYELCFDFFWTWFWCSEGSQLSFLRSTCSPTLFLLGVF